MSTAQNCWEWTKYIPWVSTALLGAYIVFKMVKKDACSSGCENWINKTIDKDKPKVATSVDIEDIAETTAFCRCWKSEKFPLCDGSHNKHNKTTGDNVGPVVMKTGSK